VEHFLFEGVTGGRGLVHFDAETWGFRWEPATALGLEAVFDDVQRQGTSASISS
jgi:hypothetical protein